MSSAAATAEKKVQRTLVSSREVFVCDHFIEPAMVMAVGEYVKTLPYARSEASLADA